MKLKDLQKTVDEWVSNPNYSVKYFPPFEICAQLTEEVGEICREVAHLHGHKKKKEGEKTDGLEGEIGDVLFVLACLANSHNIDLSDAFQSSIDKKNNRDSQRFLK